MSRIQRLSPSWNKRWRSGGVIPAVRLPHGLLFAFLLRIVFYPQFAFVIRFSFSNCPLAVGSRTFIGEGKCTQLGIPSNKRWVLNIFERVWQREASTFRWDLPSPMERCHVLFPIFLFCRALFAGNNRIHCGQRLRLQSRKREREKTFRVSIMTWDQRGCILAWAIRYQL